MGNFDEFLQVNKIDEAFLQLGLDLKRVFPEKLEEETKELYSNHEWIVRKVPQFNTVINAVPPNNRIEELPWEEWYRLAGKLHHHVLYSKKPLQYDEIFNAPEHDDIHPSRTLGKTWWVIDDPDMTPVLIQKYMGNPQ